MPPYFDHNFDYLLILSIHFKDKQESADTIGDDSSEIAALIYDIKSNEILTNKLFHQKLITYSFSKTSLQLEQAKQNYAPQSYSGSSDSLKSTDLPSPEGSSTSQLQEALTNLEKYIDDHQLNNFIVVSFNGKNLKNFVKNEIEKKKQAVPFYLKEYIDLQQIFPVWMYPDDCQGKITLQQMMQSLGIKSFTNFQKSKEEALIIGKVLQHLEGSLIKFTKIMVKQVFKENDSNAANNEE